MTPRRPRRGFTLIEVMLAVGLVGVLAMYLFYRALAAGPMGIVSPITGSGSPSASSNTFNRVSSRPRIRSANEWRLKRMGIRDTPWGRPF